MDLYSQVVSAIKTLRKYNNTKGMWERVIIAEELANALENILRTVSSRDLEIAEVVDRYFKNTSEPDNLGTIDEKGFVHKEYSGEGYIFKDYDAFEKGNGICYIPEDTGNFIYDPQKYPIPEGFVLGKRYIYNPKTSEIVYFAATYTRKDFIELTGGNEKMAEVIFNLCTWSYPDSVVNDIANIGIINCPNCNWMFDTEDTLICPKCGKKIQDEKRGR